MKTQYDPRLRYFDATVHDSDGQHESQSHIVIQADNTVEARAKANAVVAAWYEGARQERCGWLWFKEVGRSVRVGEVVETGPVEFLESRLAA